MLGEAVEVVDGQDEGAPHGLAVGDLEAERLVERRVQRLAVHAGLLLALSVGHQVDLCV